MAMKLTDVRRKLEQEKGKRIATQKDLLQLTRTYKNDKELLLDLEQASVVIRTVGMETQNALQYHISDIASLAMESIFSEPYKLLLDFVDRRNKTECDIVFERNGAIFDPMGSSGGGTVDVAAFALRIACWSMAMQKTRPVIILDEPMRFLSADCQQNASEVLKELSQKLGIQFIIVTHEPTLALAADKTFTTKIRKSITKVIEQ